jgi:hypothetical protein
MSKPLYGHISLDQLEAVGKLKLPTELGGY